MNLFLNKPNKYFNLDKFVSGERHKLLVVGLSGSGKTTLAKELAEKYKAEYKSLDDFFFNNQQIKKINPEKYKVERKKFEDDILYNSGRYVVEGVGIMTRLDERTLSLPIIILGTSLLASSIRGTIRNLKIQNTEQNFFNEATVVFKKNLFKYYRQIKKFEVATMSKNY